MGVQLLSSPPTTYQKTTLPSGIRVVTEEIPYVRSVSIGVWFDVGSRDETESNNGISHFLEHMVFKGTRRYSTQQIARSLESVGGYLNAFTTKEQTCFYARVLDDSIPKALDVLSELVQHPTLPHKEIEKEKHVILEELKNIEDDPDDLIHDYLDLNMYRKHPLGFPIIGRAENIRRFDRDDMLSFIRRHYLSDRMVIAAAGNLRHESVLSLVEKFFRMDGRRSNRNSRARIYRRARSTKEVFEKPISQAHVCMGTLGYSVKNPLRYPLLVLNTLLGEGMSSRLFQNIREKYGFAYNVYSFANFFSDTGSIGIYMGTDNNNIDNSINLIGHELEKLRHKSVTNAELKRAKAQLKGSTMLGLESMSNRMMRLGSGEIYYGEFLTLDQILRDINAVTEDDVREVANKLLCMDNFSTVIFRATNATSIPNAA